MTYSGCNKDNRSRRDTLAKRLSVTKKLLAGPVVCCYRNMEEGLVCEIGLDTLDNVSTNIVYKTENLLLRCGAHGGTWHYE